MKRRSWLVLATLLAVLLAVWTAAAPALAEREFAFTDREIQLFEGDAYQAALSRAGEALGDGDLAFVSANPKVASVSAGGDITAVKKGKTQVTATLKVGKRTWKAVLPVTVLRRVTHVTLSTKNLAVYDPGDPAVAGLLKAPTDHQVLVVAAGKTVPLKTAVTPEDASNLKVAYTTDDAGVARITGTSLKAEQRGECDLVIASVQNPEVTETLRVLVIQPVKKITVVTEQKSVAAGESIQAEAVCEPSNASIQDVTWASRNPKVAEVDEEGVITGMNKGQAVIDAVAKDGSGVKGSISITVTRTAEAITLDKTEASAVVKGNPAYLRATVLPADTNDKKVTWESSDESIATVSQGKVVGVRAGECIITARSVSDPSLTASARITVIQRVTRISFSEPGGISVLTGESAQLGWIVEPDDATDKSVTFTSSAPKVVSVSATGEVTGLKRGTATITARAADKSGKAGQVRVTVIQPVEGVTLKATLHHVQLYEEYHRATAITIPKDANNQNMIWGTGDPSIATARGTGNSCYLTGHRIGTTTLRVITEDGGYTATGEIRVNDYNGAIMVEGLTVDANNQIRITLRNMSDFTVNRVYFRVECYDRDGNPMVCNTDGESTFFDGSYQLPIDPGQRSIHGYFSFPGASYSDPLGAVVVTVNRYTDLEGFSWSIPEDVRVPMSWDWRFMYNGYSENG